MMCVSAKFSYNVTDGDGISEDELAVVLKSTLMAAKA